MGVLLATLGWLFWSPESVPPREPLECSPISNDEFIREEPPVQLSPNEQFAQDVLSRPIKEAIALADETLLSTDIETAQELYKQLLNKSDGQFKQDLQYRVAICCELLGNANEAFESYEKVITDGRDSAIQQAAMIGISRTRVRDGKFRAASSQLCQSVLTLPETPTHEAFRGEACYLLAYCRFRDAIGDSLELLEDDQLAIVPLDWSPRHLLELAQQIPGDKTQREAKKTKVEVLHRYGELPSNVYFRIHAPEARLIGILREIAMHLKLNITWTPEHEGSLNDRVVELSVDNMSLALILDCLLTPLDLTWSINGKGIHITSATEPSDDDQQESLPESLLRVLQYATITFPQHPYAAAALMQLAHVNFLQQNTDDAVSYCNQFLDQFTRSPGKREVWFNLAKMRYQQMQIKEAIDSFNRVTDYGKEHTLAGTAQLFVGRVYVESGNAANAIKPLASALSLTSNHNVTVKSAIMLASAYTLEKKYDAAVRVLYENCDTTMSDSDRAAALLVDRYAKYSLASRQQLNQAGTMLVMSLTRIQPEHFFGSVGYILLGRIYREVGLEGQMAQMYRNGIEKEQHGLLRDRMKLALADYAKSKGDLLAAKSLLTEILENETSPAYIQAKLRLAQISFTQNENDRCLELCNNIVQRNETASKAESLRLMGQVYQRLKDYDSASMCYAGILPGQSGLKTGRSHKESRIE